MLALRTDTAHVSLSVVSGVLAAGLSGVFSLAQVLHIIRRKSTTGLSDVTWLLLVLTSTTWLAWGVLQADLYLISTNTASVAGASWVLWRIYRDERIAISKICRALAAVLVAFGLQILGGAAGALLAVLSITGYIRFRQQKTVRKAMDISGVALSPWVISSVAQVMWCVYGLTAGKIVLAIHAPFAIASNLALMYAVWQRRSELESL